MNTMTHNLARVGVGDQAQVSLTLTHWQIGDIGHPHVFWPLGKDLMLAGFEKIGMLAKAMMTVCSLVIGPLAGNQQAVFT